MDDWTPRQGVLKRLQSALLKALSSTSDPLALGILQKLNPEQLLTWVQNQLVNHKPRTDDELHAYIAAFYGLELPRVDVCPGHTAPFNVWKELFFRRVNDAIIIGSRESGKTLGYAVLDHLQMGLDGADIANAGAIEAQALKCYSYIEGFCRLPWFQDWLLKAPMLSKTFFKNGGFLEVLPMTMSRLNSPHPNIANADEVELTTWKLIQEMNSMPIRKGDKPPAIRYTSSRKKAYGPLEQLLKESERRGLTVWTWCVMEVSEECKPERHQDGVGCRGVLRSGVVGDPVRDTDASDWTVPPCPLREDCLLSKTTAEGNMEYEDGPGRLVRARGFIPVDDVIRQKKLMDADTWQSQWLSKRPMLGGLIYPKFDPAVHVFEASEWGGPGGYHEALPVFMASDFGYTNPWCNLYAQVTPTDELVIFSEDYERQVITQRWAERIKHKPWYDLMQWAVGDPAGADERATLQDNGIRIHAADNEKDRGIKRVRYLLDPPDRGTPMIYISKACVNLLEEITQYHIPDVRRPDNQNEDEEPAKIFDHAMDSLRYLVSEIYGSRLKI